jgi:hypothetical protein
LCCLWSGGHQAKPIQFKKSGARQETGTLVPINKRMALEKGVRVIFPPFFLEASTRSKRLAGKGF